MDEYKKCPTCGDKIIGRIDKKYCSDQCRSLHNNKEKKYYSELTRKVDRILKKNRRILQELNPTGKGKTHISRLNEKGFVFDYFTNIYTTKSGNIYYFIYEEGYLKLSEEYFALVRRQEKE